jgi:hypothetical protein
MKEPQVGLDLGHGQRTKIGARTGTRTRTRRNSRTRRIGNGGGDGDGDGHGDGGGGMRMGVAMCMRMGMEMSHLHGNKASRQESGAAGLRGCWGMLGGSRGVGGPVFDIVFLVLGGGGRVA